MKIGNGRLIISFLCVSLAVGLMATDFSFAHAGSKAGVKKSGKHYFYYNSKGKKAKAKKERLVKWKGNTYSVKKNGMTRTGWQTYGKHLYYFQKPDGRMAKNKTVSHIRLQANGRAYMTLDAAIKYKCINDIKKVSSLDKKKSRQLLDIWHFMSSKKRFSYSTKTYPEKGDKSWPKNIAYKTISSRKGNCYGFACAFAAYAETMGYDPYVVTGRCPGGRDRAADGYTRHCVVKINGKWYDPEANNVGWIRGIYKKKNPGFRFKSRKSHRYKKIKGTGKTSLISSSGKSLNYTRQGNKYYCYNASGKPVKGYRCISGRLFNFSHKNSQGHYMTVSEYKN